jgi:hypothetical protein
LADLVRDGPELDAARLLQRSAEAAADALEPCIPGAALSAARSSGVVAAAVWPEAEEQRVWLKPDSVRMVASVLPAERMARWSRGLLLRLPVAQYSQEPAGAFRLVRPAELQEALAVVAQAP